jgi:hypothetical protein
MGMGLTKYLRQLLSVSGYLLIKSGQLSLDGLGIGFAAEFIFYFGAKILNVLLNGLYLLLSPYFIGFLFRQQFLVMI